MPGLDEPNSKRPKQMHELSVEEQEDAGLGLG